MADPIVNEPSKVCSKCLERKTATVEFFTRRKDSRCDWKSHCRECTKAAGRARWSDPSYHAKELAKRAVRYADPSFQMKERLRQEKRQADPLHLAYEANRQKGRKADAAYQQSEVERGRRRREDEEYRARVRSYGKKWYAANSVRHGEIRKAWYESNKDEVRAKRSAPLARERTNKWTRDHLRKNPHLKVIRSVGSAIAEILKEGRISGAFRFLPYTKVELRSHLERQFVRGMSWKNYGSAWHVDHILPQASFRIDPSDPINCAEFQACWALTNLRPLWKRDNQVKSARRTHLI